MDFKMLIILKHADGTPISSNVADFSTYAACIQGLEAINNHQAEAGKYELEAIPLFRKLKDIPTY